MKPSKKKHRANLVKQKDGKQPNDGDELMSPIPSILLLSAFAILYHSLILPTGTNYGNSTKTGGQYMFQDNPYCRPLFDTITGGPPQAWLCLLCKRNPRVSRTPQGMVLHLKYVHKITVNETESLFKGEKESEKGDGPVKPGIN